MKIRLRRLIIAREYVGYSFIVHKGNVTEEFVCFFNQIGFSFSAFVFTKKYFRIHENNRVLRKRQLRKVQLRNKSKMRKLGKGKKAKAVLKKKSVKKK